MSDLKERCREILAWQKTGILPGQALRTFAQQKWGDDHTNLQLAESDTVREALEAFITSKPGALTQEDYQRIANLMPIIENGPDCPVTVPAAFLWHLVQAATGNE